MKRTFCFVTLGLFAVALAGCNASWPSCFRNPCGNQNTYMDCDDCTSCYSPEVMQGEWVTEPMNTIDTLPGPTPSSTSG